LQARTTRRKVGEHKAQNAVRGSQEYEEQSERKCARRRVQKVDSKKEDDQFQFETKVYTKHSAKLTLLCRNK
jgi:hypothetical protein